MKGQILGIVPMIFLAIFIAILVFAVYSIIYYLRLLVVILSAVFSFIYMFYFLRKEFDLHPWISFGLSFLVTSGVIVWVYQSWVYISFLLLSFLVIWYLTKKLGLNVMEYVKREIKEMEEVFKK